MKLKKSELKKIIREELLKEGLKDDYKQFQSEVSKTESGWKKRMEELDNRENSVNSVRQAQRAISEILEYFKKTPVSEALGTAYWRMRFKLVFNTVTAESTGGKSFFTNFFIVDSGTSSSGVGSENGFGFKFIADAGSTQTQFYSTTNGTDSGTSMSWTPASGNTI